MKEKLRRIFALLLALVLTLALAACSNSGANTSESPGTSSAQPSADSETSGEPVYGGSVTSIALANGIVAFYDPSAMADSVTYALWLESLWSFDISSDYAAYSDNIPSSVLKGQLADSWTWDEETATLTVTLKEVYFQKLDDKYDYYGGRQLTATDVKWSYDRLTGLGSGYDEPMQTDAGWASNLSMLAGVEVIDDQTVAFTLTSGDEVTLDSFMTQFVKIGGPEWDELSEEQQSDYHYACGTGPFYLSSLEAGVQVVLTKNENYYDYDPRYPDNKLPYLDSITFVSIPDTTNIVTQFTSNKLDIIASSTLSESEEAQIEASGVDYYTLSFTTDRPEYLALRCNTEPFNDKNVRLAMQLAIDLDTIHSQYLGLDGDVELSALWNPGTTEWSTVDEWDDELRAEYSYDPERAKELLAEAGYPDGFEITVAIDTTMDTDLWQLCAEYWAAIGVTVHLDMYQTYMEVKTIATDASQTVSTGSTGAGAVASLTAAQNQTIDGGWASGLWHGNAEYTDLLAQMAAATTLTQQADLAKQADLIYAQEHWTVNLTGMQQAIGFYSARLHMYENGYIGSGKIAGPMFSTMWVDG